MTRKFVGIISFVVYHAHWDKFKPVFNIPEYGERGRAKNLKWMERINELRRISAHPTEKRRYKIEDFEYIDFIYEEFTKRLGAEKAESDEMQ